MSKSKIDIDYWQQQVSNLLNELTETQDELLKLLESKREAMVGGDIEQINGFQQREAILSGELQAVLLRRQELLDEAEGEGIKAGNLRELIATLGNGKSGAVGESMKSAKLRTMQLQHTSITNWVLAQKSVLHLAQLMEIVASGGQIKPTYGEGDSIHCRGTFVDEAA